MNRTEALIASSQAGNAEARELLVKENMGLIWSVTRRFIGRGVETDDLFQLGCLGFIKAVDGFNLQFGTQFSTYAVPKIAGEIRRYLRDNGTLKVARSIKEQSAALNSIRNEMMNTLGREPTIQELSEQTGIQAEDIAMIDNATAAVESISHPTSDSGFTLEDILSDTEDDEGMIEKMALKEAISKLPERDRKVIHLRYFHGLTQNQVSRILAVSQVQISRIEKRAIDKLRQLIS